MIDPLERWREYGEKPDYAGLLTFAGAPYTQDPRRARGRRRRDRRRADRRPRLRPARHRFGAARDPRRQLPARPAPRGEDRRVRGAARSSTSATRPCCRPIRRARTPRSNEPSGRSSPPARFPIILGGDHSIAEPDIRACATVHGPVGLIHFDTHTDTGREVFGVEISHGTPMFRLVEAGHVAPEAVRADRTARVLAGRA